MLEHPKTRSTDKVKMIVMSESEMGNQQERLDAARLAMFIDTDGWISMRVLQRAKTRLANVRPELGVVNTSKPLVEWAAEALKRLGVPHHILHLDVAKYEKAKGNKMQYRITIVGLRRVLPLLPHIIPYLVAKRSQAELLQEFIISRLGKPAKATYDDRELAIANEVRGLNSNKPGNWRPISPETVRAAQELRAKLTGMRQSDLTRERENTVETSVSVA